MAVHDVDRPVASTSVLAATPTTYQSSSWISNCLDFRTNHLPSYTPDLSQPGTSLDEHYLTLALIYSRLSMSRRGSMACIFVKPPPTDHSIRPWDPDSTLGAKSFDFLGSVLVHSNNTPLPSPMEYTPGNTKNEPHLASSSKHYHVLQSKQTELHAEARCISVAASRGINLQGSTAYITFPPCYACFPLLLTCGVKRLVYRRSLLLKEGRGLANEFGIDLVEVMTGDEKMRERAAEYWLSVGETKEMTRERSEKWWAEKGWPKFVQKAALEAKQGSEGAVREEFGEGLMEDGPSELVGSPKRRRLEFT
ncbi:BZ3500_MvSof-1268-A1-R1_Chr2-3g05241 [Microbotryum saponariae]|uniref:BZ3500_MvSof-1268-A1-R1_Chr2-3g05241 protein n=1 Tax=Microbotryum saponariae TaxID=289078 RepID=A0A2X0KXF9_9BASI|nr:BZ3500_MvSof-1268-A1-R1_Chr2-3g05241 [Microbotryum saponariae]SDA01067.1 BZ3501_MvSof-1269-A2-R1_Chr2-2g04914 [Microbotryum saponariae]